MVTTACWSKANVELRTIDGRNISSKLRDLGCAYAEEANKGEHAVCTSLSPTILEAPAVEARATHDMPTCPLESSA